MSETLTGFAADILALSDRRRPGRQNVSPELIPLLRGASEPPVPVQTVRRASRIGKHTGANIVFLLAGLPMGIVVRQVVFFLAS